MKKIGTASGKILLSVTPQEFKRLTKVQASTIPDGTDINITWLTELVNVIDTKKPLFVTVKTNAEALASSIGDIINA